MSVDNGWVPNTSILHSAVAFTAPAAFACQRRGLTQILTACSLRVTEARGGAVAGPLAVDGGARGVGAAGGGGGGVDDSRQGRLLARHWVS